MVAFSYNGHDSRKIRNSLQGPMWASAPATTFFGSLKGADPQKSAFFLFPETRKETDTYSFPAYPAYIIHFPGSAEECCCFLGEMEEIRILWLGLLFLQNMV